MRARGSDGNAAAFDLGDRTWTANFAADRRLVMSAPPRVLELLETIANSLRSACVADDGSAIKALHELRERLDGQAWERPRLADIPKFAEPG
jgi:hypothetical protein